jgi:hypothetical protein
MTIRNLMASTLELPTLTLQEFDHISDLHEPLLLSEASGS